MRLIELPGQMHMTWTLRGNDRWKEVVLIVLEVLHPLFQIKIYSNSDQENICCWFHQIVLIQYLKYNQ